MSEHEKYLKTKESAQKLGVSVQTIYKYVKEKRLRPVYEDKWQIDETLLFRLEDVEQLKKENEKPGLTTGDVAQRLGVHPTTVASYIKQGLLTANKQLYRGRYINIVSEEDFKSFSEDNYLQKDRDHKSFYSKKFDLYLYQSLVHEDSGENARVWEISSDEVKIVTEHGQTIVTDDIEKGGFSVAAVIPQRKYFTKPGYVHFRFAKPRYIGSQIYFIIEMLYKAAGYKNIRLTEKDGEINLEVKPILLEALTSDLNESEIEILRKSLVEGEVVVRHNGVLLESGLEPLIIHLPADLKVQVKNAAEAKNMYINDYVVELIKSQLTEDF